MQLRAFTIVLCIGTAAGSVLRAAPEVPEVPEVKKPKVPDAKVPEVKKPKVPEAKVPDAKVPKAEVPEVKKPKVPKTDVPDVKKPKVPKADVPEVKKPKVPEADVPEVKKPKVPEAKVPEGKVPEVEKPEVVKPEVKCGPTKPWSEHTPMEPDVNDIESMCQACKIRACNAKLPMPGDGGKACRCQYSRVGETFQTDCKPPFADGVESVGEWNNCPGGVRDCEELEGQCVSATFKMDSAPEAPKLPSGAAAKTMMPLAALALFFLA